jgi:hypothetical protein
LQIAVTRDMHARFGEVNLVNAEAEQTPHKTIRTRRAYVDAMLGKKRRTF